MIRGRELQFLPLILVMVGSYAPQSAWAHPSPHSLVELDIHETTVGASLHLPLSELEIATKQKLVGQSLEQIRQHEPELLNYISSHIEIETPQGVWEKKVEAPIELADVHSTSPDLVANLVFVPTGAPKGNVPEDFVLNSNLIEQQVPSHKIFVTIRNDWANGVFSDQSKLVTVLRYLRNTAEIHRGDGNYWTGFVGTFKLGMRHIAEGTDHLAFLLMLILSAPLLASKRRWQNFGGVQFCAAQVLKLVTAFTIGHSLTLLLGALNVVHLSERLTESLIALSVLISAAHAIRPLFPGREWQVALGFGLIHGLSFSSVIQEFGLSHSRLVLSILGFNLGIELMQLLILLSVIPWILIAAVTDKYYIFRNALAAIGICTAASWVIERALALNSNPVGNLVETAVKAPLAVYLAITSSSVLVFLFSRKPRSLEPIKELSLPR